ncbi:MAG TPA: POTRA domain-containing protein [Terriglobales bacterium]|nr:POTRA domain-containing protein [Terriglobales bacterium]
MPSLLRAPFVLVLSTFLVGQSQPANPNHLGATSLSAYKLLSIKITGTKLYTPEEVIAATRLRIGEEVTEQNFKEASQRLGETGAFTEITYGYSYSPAGTKLEIQLADNDKLIPVYFDNFVWFSDQELVENLRQHVPLFKNRLPVGGPLADELSDVLNIMLSQRGIAGHSHYVRFSASPDGPIESFLYSVEGTDITVRNVDFPGANPAQLPALREVAKKEIEESEYLRSKLAAIDKVAIRPVYLKQGYLKVAFGDAQPELVSTSPTETIVDVKLPVQEGQQYRLASIIWTGSGIIPAEKLQPLIHGVANQPADAVRLEKDFQAVRQLYGARGYVKARVTSQPEFNDNDSTVAYTVQVKEGDLYHMGDLDIEGLDDKAAARLREDWKLREGEPYDSSYPQRYLKDASADLPTGVRWGMKVNESLIEKDKTVDVTLLFSPE